MNSLPLLQKGLTAKIGEAVLRPSRKASMYDAAAGGVLRSISGMPPPPSREARSMFRSALCMRGSGGAVFP